MAAHDADDQYNLTPYNPSTAMQIPPARISSTPIALDNSSLKYQLAHGLGRDPQKVQGVLVCVTADAGSASAVGDEIPVGSVSDGVEAGTIGTIFADKTNITLATTRALVGNEASWNVRKKDGTGNGHFTSFSNFKLKFYYQ